ncbi:hypothetical protein [Variovorax rhizosphaerae]|uniref:Uncharacterized protein n=1 Tax=Variovorax rhizosphaerae TaxID=1836200 RepID=A0ABU8WFV5_9BURK
MAATTPAARAAITLAPMSATAAADAVAPAEGTILLSPPAACDLYFADDTSCAAYYSGGCRTSLYHHHGRAYWTGDESRTDGDGRRWERRIRAVVDDFGALVEVQS